MRIVQTVTLASKDGAFGGPLAVAIAQCRELARRGHDVTLLAGWDGKLELTIPGVRVILSRGQRLPGAGFSGVRAPALLKWLAENQRKIDLVHVHSGRHALDLELASTARRLGVPYFLQTHGMVMPSNGRVTRILDSTVTKPLLRSAAAVFVLTEAEATGVHRIEPGARVRIVRNGLAVLDRPVKSGSTRPEVLFLARLHPRKRVLAFAEMAKLLADKRPDVQFSVVGPDEGDLGKFEQFRLENPEVPLAYEGAVGPGSGGARIARADVYVLPSRGEVFPVTALEALAAGTAVVLTRDCGIATRLEAAGAASISDGTPADLAVLVENLLANTQERVRQTDNGRDLIAGELGIETTMNEIVTEYTAVLKRGSRPKVVWVTNQAAPYRIPVWEALAEHVNLEIWLLESDKKLHRDRNNRGADWEVRGRAFNFSIRTIPTYAVHRGEARHYIAGWLGAHRLKDVDGVLIGGWDSPAYWSVERMARRAGVRRIGFYESHLLTQRNASGPFAAARRWFFRSLDGVVVPGVAARDALLHEGVDSAKIHVGFNAVDVHRIHAETNAQRAVNPRTDNDLRLLVVSQLIERKNVGEVIRALREPGLEHAKLTVVGTGPLEAELAHLIHDLELTHRAKLVGYLPGATLPRVFADHDVLVHPAVEEVWGLVVNEALAAGLHVVVSDRSGVAQSVREMTGVSLAQPDHRSIARATREIQAKAFVRSPEILSQGPEPFARIFAHALIAPPREEVVRQRARARGAGTGCPDDA